MDKVFVAQRICDRTIAAEVAVDHAIAEASQLVLEMMQARETLGVSTKLGNGAVVKATETLAALSQARSALVSAHEEFAEAKLRLGIRTKLAGQNSQEIETASSHLRRAV